MCSFLRLLRKDRFHTGSVLDDRRQSDQMALQVIRNNPGTIVAVGFATGVFVWVNSSKKPVSARVAEMVRGSTKSEPPAAPLARPDTVSEGKIRICLAGYQH